MRPCLSRERCIAVVLTLVLALSASMPPALAAPIRLLVLGDSLSAGYGLPHADGFEVQLQQALHARGYDVSIIDGAVSGDTTAGGRARLDWVLADGADAAIVELGANDGLRGVDPKDMDANLTAILDALAAKHMPVLLDGHVRTTQPRAGLRTRLPRSVRQAGRPARRVCTIRSSCRAWRRCRP